MYKAHLITTQLGETGLGIIHVGFGSWAWPDPIDDVEEAWATFAELKEVGLARSVGVSNFDVEQHRRIESIAPVVIGGIGLPGRRRSDHRARSACARVPTRAR